MDDFGQPDLRDFLDDPKAFRLVARDAAYVRLQHRRSSAVTDWIALDSLADSVIARLPEPDADSCFDVGMPARHVMGHVPPMTGAYLAAFTKSDLEDIGSDFSLVFVSRATKAQMVAAIVDVQRDDGREQ